MKIGVRVDTQRVMAAFARAPGRMRQLVGDGVARGAQEVSREARQRAPKSFTTLADSILPVKVDELHWLVRPGMNYARAVEEGTKPGYTPNLLTLRMYVQASIARGKGFRFARPGTTKRSAQEEEIYQRTSALAWFIRAHGTKAHPYMRPAAEVKESRVIALIREAAHRGALEVMR